MKEVEIMSKIFNPHVALFMGVCMIPQGIRIVSELLCCTVESMLNETTKYTALSERLRWAKEMAIGVAWLHGNSPPLIHRDLKTSNLLADENGKVKVCDFGLSEFKSSADGATSGRPIGTPLYMAPEVMTGGSITEAVDVYSMGLLIWEMITRKPVFSNHSNYPVFRKAVCELRERPPIPPGLLPELEQLMKDCWEHEYSKRPYRDWETN